MVFVAVGGVVDGGTDPAVGLPISGRPVSDRVG